MGNSQFGQKNALPLTLSRLTTQNGEAPHSSLLTELRMGFFDHKRVVVTGGAGFLGRHVVAKLKERGATKITVPRSQDYDLREKEAIVTLYSSLLTPHPSPGLT